jgi:hypothetical protein
VGLDGIGLVAGKEGGAIVLVALRIATGDGDVGMGDGTSILCVLLAELLEEVQEVVGILSGGIESDVEVDRIMPLGDVFEPLAQLRVTVGGLGEGQFVAGGLEVMAKEGGVVSVA